MPNIGSKPPEARGEAWDRVFLPASEGTDTADTLIWGS